MASTIFLEFGDLCFGKVQLPIVASFQLIPTPGAGVIGNTTRQGRWGWHGRIKTSASVLALWRAADSAHDSKT